MDVMTVKATLCVVQETKELICLASLENGYGAWCPNSVHYLADVKNNKRIHSKEN